MKLASQLKRGFRGQTDLSDIGLLQDVKDTNHPLVINLGGAFHDDTGFRVVRLHRHERFFERRQFHRLLVERDAAGDIDQDAVDFGVGIDVLTIQDRLRNRGWFVAAGGFAWLCSLQDTTPSAANLEYYFPILAEAQMRRAVLRDAAELQHLAMDESISGDVLADAARRLGQAYANTAGNGAPAVQSLGEIEHPSSTDPTELVQHRLWCRGTGQLLVGPTGIGKTTFVLQAMLCFGCARECFGFKPTGSLRSLYVQAENDSGDLAELRDGILVGLHFSDSEKAEALANVRFATIDDKCGVEFVDRVLAPLCAVVKPDILWLDPLLAYLGGDVSRQEVVSPLLRNHLNPLLHQQGMACVLVHHTNKPPSGKEKANWQAGDFAYIGTGSSELANWARSVVAIRSTGSHDVFELRLGKRGARAGWENPDGTAAYSRFIAHGSDGIYWREADDAEVPATAGRKADHTVEDIVALLDSSLPTAEWQKLARAECGISERSFYRLKKQAEAARLVSQSKTDRRWFRTP